MKSVLTPLVKYVLLPFGLSAAMSATDGAIQRKIVDGWTTSVVSNNEMEDIMKVVNSLEDSELLIKGISEKK